MSVTVGIPWALLGLLLVPLLVVAALRSRLVLSRGRRVMLLVLRAIVVILVVLAAADLRIGWPTDDLAVATLIDRSASISTAEQAELETRLAGLMGARTDVRFQPIDDAEVDPFAVRLDEDVSTAVALLPRDRVRRIMLATDGRDVGNDVLAAIDAARTAGVTVDVLPLGSSPPIDLVAVADVDAPRLVRAGERLELGIVMTASRPSDVELVARIDGEEAARETVSVAAGEARPALGVTFPEEEGVHALEIQARAAGDVLAMNDTYRTLVRVLSRPRVLLLHEPDTTPALVSVLDDAELEVDSRNVTDAPASVAELDRFGLVVVDEADLGDMSESQQVAVRAFVEDLGGGLLTITGENPVTRTPELLREIEPIRPPPAIPEPRPLELILVIDRSSSMEGQKMAMARRAAISAVQALRDDALVGVVAFSGGADRVMAPVPVAEDAQRQEVISFISRIGASGGTNIAAALGAARAIMSNDPRYIHHVVVLSDGESDPAPALAQASGIASAGTSITTITIGPYSHLMAEIARIGRGRYHVTNNPVSLPALLVREASFRQPPANRQGRIQPRVAMEHRSVAGIDFASGPPVLGHVLSAARPGADTILQSTDESPIFAHWHHGLGQVGTYTSATTGGWANEQREWQGFRAFFSQTAWALMRARTVDPLELRVTDVPGQPGVRRVLAVAPSIHMTPVPVAHVTRAVGQERDLELEPIGPGLFAADVEIGDGFLVDARLPTDPEPTAAVAVDRPYDSELARFGTDAAMLARLAELGGGRVLASADEAVAAVEPATVARSLRTIFFAAALLFYLLSVLLVRLPDRAVASAAADAQIRHSRPPGMRTSAPGVKKEAA